jgi:hypothetical protein
VDKLKPFSDAFNHNSSAAPECYMSRSDSKLHIADKRMARLLLVMHEIDRVVGGLRELPQSDLIQIASSAILACGFADGTEARHAITEVLEVIDRNRDIPERLRMVRERIVHDK